LSLLLVRIYCKGAKMPFLEFIGFIVAIALVDMMADSRMALLLAVFTMGFFWLNNLLKSKLLDSAAFSVVSVILLPICFTMNLLLAIYGIQLENFIAVNDLLSGRLVNSHWIYLNNPVTLLGNPVDVTNTIPRSIREQTPYNHGLTLVFDNSYLFLLLAFGIVGTLFVLIGIPQMILRANKKGDRVLSFISCVYIILGLLSADLLRSVFNFTVMFMFSSFAYVKTKGAEPNANSISSTNK